MTQPPLVVSDATPLIAQRQTMTGAFPATVTHDVFDDALRHACAHQHTLYDRFLTQHTLSTRPLPEPEKIYPYDSHLQMSGTLYHHGTELHLYCKGSPDMLLPRCDLTDSEYERAMLSIQKAYARGEDVLVLALSQPPTPPEQLADIIPLHTTYLGYVTVSQTPSAQQMHIAQRAQQPLVILTVRPLPLAQRLATALLSPDTPVTYIDASLPDAHLPDVITEPACIAHIPPHVFAATQQHYQQTQKEKSL